MSTQPAAGPVPRKRGVALVKAALGIGVLLAAVAGGVSLMSGGGSGDDRGLDVHVVSRQDFVITATAIGELRAKKQTVLRSELDQDAPIVEIVPEGARVSRGDVIVRLNGDDLRSDLENEILSLESSRAEVITAENSLAIQITENEAAIRKAGVEVRLAEVELRKFEEGDAVERRLELKLAVERGEREVERLREKVERSENLYGRNFLSEDELKRDQLEYIEARAQLQKALVALDTYNEYTYSKERMRLESDLDQARTELEKTKRRSESDLITKEADLTNKRRHLAIREERVRKLEDLLAKTVIRAPTDGLVVYATSLEQFAWMNNSEPLNVGTNIRPNQEIIMLPDTTEMVAAVRVAESLIGRVRPGQSATVTIDAAQGKSYSGSVEAIGIMAQTGGWRDPNVREYEVRVALDLGDQPHALKPSMRCEARITLMEVDNAVAVPLQAVFTEGPHQFVYKAAGDRYHQTPVRIGRRSDTTAEVLDGLGEGDRVVLREPPVSRIVRAALPQNAGPRSPGGPPRGDGGRERAEGARPVVSGAPAGATGAKTVEKETDGSDGPSPDEEDNLDDLLSDDDAELMPEEAANPADASQSM